MDTEPGPLDPEKLICALHPFMSHVFYSVEVCSQEKNA